MKKESLHDAAMRVTGKRGCSVGCSSGKCEFVGHRDDNGVCLIRRIAQCGNADEQIELLEKWQVENPAKPTWIMSWNGAMCSNCRSVLTVERTSSNGYSVAITNPKWKYCPMCGVRMDGAGE